MARIMDPFFTTKRDIGGTGLGLSVSSKIIKEHGGKLDVKSKEGSGAAFEIILPLTPVDKAIHIRHADGIK